MTTEAKDNGYPNVTEEEGTCIITKDGKISHSSGEGWVGKRYGSVGEAFAALFKMQSASVSHALTYEGYAIVHVPADRWSDQEANAIRRHAQSFAFDHGQPYHGNSRLARENCSACCLKGYFPQGTPKEDKENGPNVSNWQRDYVQVGRAIPKKWENAFWSFRDSDNELWKAALELDIATFGVRFS